MYYGIQRSNSLCHFGILGQKWHVRRYQNEDGTYTEEGKKRRSLYSSREADNDVKNMIINNKEKHDKIIANSEKVPEMADDVMKEYKRFFKDVKLTPNLKNKIVGEMEKNFGINENSKSKTKLGKIRDNCDDDDYFDMILEEVVEYKIHELAASDKKIKTKRSEFEKAQKEYWDHCKQLTKDIVEKYDRPGVTISGYGPGSSFVNEVVYGQNMNSSFMAYLSRHFEDYWINDLDENYAAQNRILKEIKKDLK